MCNLAARMKRWLTGKEIPPANLYISVEDLVQKLASVGYLKLSRNQNGGMKVTLQIDRGRLVIFLNRIMMLKKEDQETLINLVHHEIKLLLSTQEATQMTNLRGIFGNKKKN